MRVFMNTEKIGPFFTWPNILTFFRVLLIPVVIYFFKSNRPIASLCVYVLAAVTDLVDGYLARKLNQISNLGKVIDPIADKGMYIVAMICLYQAQYLNLFALVLSAVKEFLMVTGGVMIYLILKNVVTANRFGKVTAFLCHCGLILTFLHPYIHPVDDIVMIASVCLNILALLQYAYLNAYIPLRKRARLKRS